MKRLFLLSTLLIVVGCAGMQPAKSVSTAPPCKIESQYSATGEIVGKSKDALFEKSKLWFFEQFHSQNDTIKYENKEEGVIIALGSRERFVSAYGRSCNVVFAVKMKVKDQWAEIILTDMGLRCGNIEPPGGIFILTNPECSLIRIFLESYPKSYLNTLAK